MTKVGNVISISHEDWYLMRMLNESVKHMSSIDEKKYKLAIGVHKNTYKNILKEVADSK